MSSKTRIVVLRLKEVICTGIFVILGILLIVLLVVLFFPKNKDAASTSASASADVSYIHGIYVASLRLDDSAVTIEVTVDNDYISSVTISDIDESVSILYPLLEPALNDIADQLIEKQSLEEITYSDDMRYTSLVLINAIESALQKAQTGAL